MATVTPKRRVETFFIDRDGCRNLPVYVFGSGRDDCTLGLIVDISESGAQVMIDHEQPFPTGDHAVTILPIPQLALEGFDLTASVVWTKEGKAFSHKVFGIQFTNLDESTTQRIAALMTAYEERGTPDTHIRCELQFEPGD